MEAYKEALDWLYSTQLFGIKLGLEGITRLLRECGVLYPRAFVIHVAGTNGKGSTCAFAESIARAAGYKTGLFTSPHLIDFGERIRVNGENIAPEDATRLINRVRTHVESWEVKPTFFELVLAVAMMHFAEQEVELIVLETGMGGRLDATNALPKDVAVLTPIGLDHTQYLGDSLGAIAAEKAAIFAWHRPALSAPQEPEANLALEASARRMDTQLRFIAADACPDLPLGLRGAHQRGNAALAVAALRALPHFLCSEEELARGLREVRWPGRFEEVLPGVIMDGAHNPPALRVLAASWREAYGTRRARCIFAGAADKALDEVIALLAPLVEQWVLPPVASPRMLPPAELAEKLRAQLPEASLELPASLAEVVEGLDAESNPLTLFCGSFFLLGESKALLAKRSDYRKTVQ